MTQPDAAELKLIRQTKFPPEFKEKVDTRKVNLDVIKKWMAEKMNSIMGVEDEVAVEFAYELVADKTNFFPNIKLLQIKLSGFLGNQSPAFCKEFWALMLSAQESREGIPAQILEAKKQELLQERVSNDSVLRKIYG